MDTNIKEFLASHEVIGVDGWINPESLSKTGEVND
jgi:hypothetical protein